MASRVAEVIYKLKDLVTAPARRIRAGYENIRGASRRTANQVENDNRRMGGSFGRLTSRVRGAVSAFAVAFAGGVTTSAIGRVADELDRLGKVSARLDIDPQTLAGLEFAAERSGVAIGKVAKSIETLQKRTGEALQGIGEARRAFDALGIEAQQFASLGAEDQIRILADAFQGLASEEERAALGSQLFSKANLEVLQVLNQGGAALEAYLDQARKFLPVTEEATKAAAAYKDAVTNLGATTEGFKFRVFTPVIETINRWVGVAGLAASETANLEQQLANARLELEWWEDNPGLNPEALERSRLEVERLAGALKKISDAQARSAAANRRAAEDRAAAAEELKAYQAELDTLTASYEKQTRTQKASLDQQTRELQAARAAQKSIEAEFKNLVEEITAPDIEEVGLAEVFGSINQAAAAASRDQSDQALALARRGAEQLRLLKEKGTELDGVLKFLAERLQAVAQEAAAQKTKIEIIDQQQALEAFANLETGLANLKSKAATEGTEIGRALVAAIQAEINASDLGLPDAVASGINSYRKQLEQLGAK